MPEALWYFIIILLSYHNQIPLFTLKVPMYDIYNMASYFVFVSALKIRTIV